MTDNNGEYFVSRMVEILGMHNMSVPYHIKDVFLLIVSVHNWYILVNDHFLWFYI